MRRATRALVFLLFAAMLWFLLVDWSWHIDECPRCFYSRDVFQYRLAGVPVWTQTREYHSLIERVAEELGMPCAHGDLPSWGIQRWWGLRYCAGPCGNGTYHITADDSLQDKLLLQARERARTDPSVRSEFRKWLDRDQDLDWWKGFLSSLTKDDTVP